MKLILFALMSLSSSAFAFQQTDYTCLNRCTTQGMSYGLCQNRCTFDSGGNSGYQAPQVKQTDFTCLNQCTSQGMMYSYCKSRCEY